MKGEEMKCRQEQAIENAWLKKPLAEAELDQAMRKELARTPLDQSRCASNAPRSGRPPVPLPTPR